MMRYLTVQFYFLASGLFFIRKSITYFSCVCYEHRLTACYSGIHIFFESILCMH